MLPLSIFASRARSVAFLAMMIAPAAMFAMFFFLSLYIQNVMGYSPLKTGLAFLPFTVGMVGGATASSKLMTKVDPRYLAGTGTLLGATALFNFARLDGAVNYWTDIAPFVLLMSIGMGLTFVPMTLVAVHGIRVEDSGIGSGVLNTMQQVGGALGLATLSTIAAHFTTEKAGELYGSLGTQPGSNPATDAMVQATAFGDGATSAFLTGGFMMLTASAIVWIFLRVKHTELNTDELPEGVGV